MSGFDYYESVRRGEGSPKASPEKKIMSDARDVIADFLYGKNQDLGTLSCDESLERANEDADYILSALNSAGLEVVARAEAAKRRSARDRVVADMDRVAHGIFGSSASDAAPPKEK